MAAEAGAAQNDRAALATGYRFAPVSSPAALRSRLEALGRQEGLSGTVLIAAEGVNLTLHGVRSGLQVFLEALRGEPGFEDFRWRLAPGPAQPPFRRLKVRVRREIVTLGRPDEPVRFEGASRIPPDGWDRILDDPSIPVIDVRNGYEIDAGRFARAIDPGTEGFREFPAWVEAHLDPATTPEVAMYCTGGIRCEKAAAWMRGRGFRTVHELDGGILAYLEQAGPGAGRWEGECFVFDERVSVREGLDPGTLELCHGCRRPVDADARQSAAYEPGVSCPACADALSDATIAARRERRRQVALAAERGTVHLAPVERAGSTPSHLSPENER
ncbi:MAG: rhodanese-like domain-containing protein [Pseudomonadales bacterium]|nr:rhodanese-like domain-containing protein [Pseudomonadales bacterium]